MEEPKKSIYLYNLLDEAANLLSEFSGGYSNHFSSSEEFHLALKKSIAKLKDGDRNQLTTLWKWFAPTCDWDDLTGVEGGELGNKIFDALHGYETL